jgi:hypothetical protein
LLGLLRWTQSCGPLPKWSTCTWCKWIILKWIKFDNILQVDSRVDDWQDKPVKVHPSQSFSCFNRWQNTGPEMRKKCFQSLINLKYLLLPVATASCFYHAISFEVVNYMLVLFWFDCCWPDSQGQISPDTHWQGVYGPNGDCAYIIGCAFSKTLGNSSLTPRVANLGFRMMVGAFHGHAHNQKCQLHWHPLYIPETGHSEGEWCEHIFSASNKLARSTKHMSPFHRHQSIEEHFAFWDKDKYAALSS